MADTDNILRDVNLLLDESAAGSMLEANARLDQILDPGPGRLLDPQFTMLRLTSALLGRLLEHRDYEAWAEEDCDATDGLLREIIAQAQALRPRLVAGIPDPPAGAEIWARAGQLTGDMPEPAAKAVRLLAAAVQAFEDAGLTDGSHFLGMCEHVWGIEPVSDHVDVLDVDYARMTLREELAIGKGAAEAILRQASEEALGYRWAAEFNPPRQGRSLSFRKITVHAVRNVPHTDDIIGFRIRYYTD